MFPRRRIFLLWVFLLFHPSRLKNIPSIVSSFFPEQFCSRNFEREFSILQGRTNSTTNILKLFGSSAPRFFTAFESQLRVTVPLKQETNGDHVHTQESRVHHFFLSYQATSQLHNSMHPPPLGAGIEDLWHTQPHARPTRTHGNR